MSRIIEESRRLSSMSMVEGIGDEVIQFFAFVSIIFLVIAAWYSTRVRESNLILTLFSEWLHMRLQEAILRRRLLSNNRNSGRNQQHRRTILDQTRESSEVDGASGEGSTASASEATGSNGVAVPRQFVNNQTLVDPVNEQGTSGSSQNDKSNVVKIKLKFPNSSVKIIEGNLNEKLGEFKRRNFNTELSQGNTVVLIFRGKVLKRDEQTLRACGVFGNCVVHCLIREPSLDTPPRGSHSGGDRPEGTFSVILLPSLGVLLVGVWYSRYRYTELFSLSATSGLMVITGLYIAFLVGCYLPDGEVNLVPIER